MGKHKNITTGKYSYYNKQIPKNNLLDFSRDLAVESGILLKCPFCDYTNTDEDVYAVHMQQFHKPKILIVLKYFKLAENEAYPNESKRESI